MDKGDAWLMVIENAMARQASRVSCGCMTVMALKSMVMQDSSC